MPVSLPDSVERWRKLLALVAAGHLTQTMLPPTWVSLVFGRIVTEPIGHLIPASMLTACTSPWGATLWCQFALQCDHHSIGPSLHATVTYDTAQPELNLAGLESQVHACHQRQC